RLLEIEGKQFGRQIRRIDSLNSCVVPIDLGCVLPQICCEGLSCDLLPCVYRIVLISQLTLLRGIVNGLLLLIRGQLWIGQLWIRGSLWIELRICAKWLGSRRLNPLCLAGRILSCTAIRDRCAIQPVTSRE